ncbi:MAG: hypothetical protein HRU17_00230 [Polyangiaceae bacterium]|nr:hypothetical protein [Polyangiaceae bacterium]
MATERADNLRKRVAFVDLQMAEPQTDGLALSRRDAFSANPEAISKLMRTRTMPIEPGGHSFEASAPGKQSWSGIGTRIRRGGSMFDDRVTIRATQRSPSELTFRLATIGFPCAQTLREL